MRNWRMGFSNCECSVENSASHYVAETAPDECYFVQSIIQNGLFMHATLPDTPLDIVGDIHGEFDALHAVLSALSYDAEGGHPDGRSLVFIGDLTGRGPDSPGVVRLVR